jgi:hypothetical protein
MSQETLITVHVHQGYVPVCKNAYYGIIEAKRLWQAEWDIIGINI